MRLSAPQCGLLLRAWVLLAIHRAPMSTLEVQTRASKVPILTVFEILRMTDVRLDALRHKSLIAQFYSMHLHILMPVTCTKRLSRLKAQHTHAGLRQPHLPPCPGPRTLHQRLPYFDDLSKKKRGDPCYSKYDSSFRYHFGYSFHDFSWNWRSASRVHRDGAQQYGILKLNGMYAIRLSRCDQK